jgi:hypothetical protein
LISSPSDDYELRILNPDGSVLESVLGAQDTGMISSAYAIKRDGVYTLRIIPLHDASMTLKLLFLNANRQVLQAAGNGYHISVSLTKNIRDYTKYRIHLNTGDTLSLPKPSDANIAFKLLNEESVVVDERTGLPLLYVAESTGDYYLFIYNKKGWGESYQGVIGITPSTGPLNHASDPNRSVTRIARPLTVDLPTRD